MLALGFLTVTPTCTQHTATVASRLKHTHSQVENSISPVRWRPEEQCWELQDQVSMPESLGACSIAASSPVALLPPAADTAQHSSHSIVVQALVTIPADAVGNGWEGDPVQGGSPAVSGAIPAAVDGSGGSEPQQLDVEGSSSSAFSVLASVCGTYLQTRVTQIPGLEPTLWQVRWEDW